MPRCPAFIVLCKRTCHAYLHFRLCPTIHVPMDSICACKLYIICVHEWLVESSKFQKFTLCFYFGCKGNLILAFLSLLGVETIISLGLLVQIPLSSGIIKKTHRQSSVQGLGNCLGFYCQDLHVFLVDYTRLC